MKVSWLLLPVLGCILFASSANGKNQIACENEKLELKCGKGKEINIQKANFGRTKKSKKVCPYLNKKGDEKKHKDDTKCKNLDGTLEVMKKRCQGKRSCQIQAKSKVFGDTCPGTFKYLEVKYQCKKSKNEGKKPKNFGCEGNKLKLKCNGKKRISVTKANFGRKLPGSQICPGKDKGKDDDTKCKDNGEALIFLQDKCNGKKNCNVKVQNKDFDDPCPGQHKYLEADFKCVDNNKQKPKHFACEKKKLKLSCPKGKTINVKFTNYGRRLSKDILCNKKKSKDSTSCLNEKQSMEVVKSRCQGKRKCNIRANNNIFDNECDGVPKYLEVEYDCDDQCPVDGALIFSGKVKGSNGKRVRVNRCIKPYQEKKTHGQAKKQCEKDGGRLLVTPTKNMMNFMTRKNIRKQLPNTYWMNGGMNKGKKIWKFKKVNYDMEREFWDKKQPNKKWEDRGCLFGKNKRKGKWALDDCSAKKSFVCMWTQKDDSVFEDPCPKSWKFMSGGCYRYFEDPKGYFAASKTCKKRGSRLAWANNARQQDRLLNYVNKKQDGAKSIVWYGLNKKNGKWQYDRNKKRAVKFQNWCDAKTKDNADKGKCVNADPANRYCQSPDSCNDKRPFVCRAGRGKARSDDCLTGRKKCSKNKKCVDTPRGARCVKQQVGSNVCQGSGDPHHRTFDGAMIHFQGICTYTFVKPCVADPAAEGLTDFHVYHKQEHRKNKTHVAFVKEVYVDVYGLTITLMKEGVVLIDGEKVSTPWFMPGDKNKLSVRLTDPKANNLVVQTDFDLVVSYLQHKKVKVQLPDAYKTKTCGICGNWDGNKKNDYFPFGEKEKGSYSEIGNSYKVKMEEEEEICQLPETDAEDTCSEEQLNNAKVKCNIFNELEEFETCRQTMSNINTYIEMCTFDLCGMDDDEAICEHLTTFSDDCVAKLGGQPMPRWRSPELCPIDCGKNAEYSYEASACPGTCAEPGADEECNLEPNTIEGCACQPGFVLSGNECVGEEDCGCKVGNKYYKRGEQWVDKKCALRSTCQGVDEEGNVKITTEDIKCGKNAKCKKRKGVRSCYCKKGFGGDPFKECGKSEACASNPCNNINSDCKEKKNGDFKCKCKKGFKTVKGSKGKLCEDIDECKKKGFCNHECSNSYGSFTCVCNEGYEGKVKKNGKTRCKDVNECKNGDAKCPENSRCKNSKGSYRCICKKGFQESTKDGKMVCSKAAKCTAKGDPHYKTFDGLVYDFMGGCTYTLSKPCQKVAELPDWNVEAKNRPSEKKPVAYQDYLNIDIYDQRIRIGPKRKVQIGVLKQTDDVRIGTDYIKYNLPVKKVETLPGIEIKRSGKMVIFKTDFGLKVTWDGKTGVQIFVPEVYAGMLCGICGNYNGDKKDDLATAQGEIIPCKPFKNKRNKKKCKNPDLGNSYRVPDFDSPQGCEAFEIPECDPAKEAEYEKKCAPLGDKNGPLGDCIKDLKPEEIEEAISDCVFDACMEPEKADENICAIMGEVVQECAGENIKGWREKANCPMKCPKGMDFSYEASGCPASCEDPNSELTCNTDDTEGCQCPEGLVMLGDKCVKPEECGCSVPKTGQRLAIGESYTSKNCKKEFVCQKNGKFKKQNAKKCHKNAKCQVKDGSRGCHCKNGFRGDGIKDCKNINECEEPIDSPDVHKCSKNANCKDKKPNKKSKRGYKCKCKKGFEGDGITCDAQPGCTKNSKYVKNAKRCNKPCEPLKFDCVIKDDEEGQCLCNKGFFYDEGKCIKARECGCPVVMDEETQEVKRYKVGDKWRDDQCNQLKCKGPNNIVTKSKGCGEHASCGPNEDGEQICLCDEGYKGNPYKKCKDINECKDKPCPAKSKCKNVEIGEDPKGYKCECKDGKAPVNGQCSKVPKPIDEETKCEEGKQNLVPFGNGICLELVEEPKKDQEEAEKFCLDNGGKLLTINSKKMNNWVKKWLKATGVDEAGLGMRRDLDLPWEGRGASQSKVACEDDVLNLRCPKGMKIQIRNANYGRLVKDDGSEETCTYGKPHKNEDNCKLRKTKGVVKRMCNGKRTCDISASNGFFKKDPCQGTYKMLDVEYTCARADTVCEDTQATLTCPEYAVIDIIAANFGRTKGKNVCPHKTLDSKNKKCFSKGTVKKLRQLCKDSSTCTFDVNSKEFGDSCPDTGKYLQVSYHCVDPQRGYRWVGGNQIQYSNWKGKPRLQSPKDCAKFSSAKGKWFQMGCDSKLSFVCEYGEELPEDPEDPWDVPAPTEGPETTEEPEGTEEPEVPEPTEEAPEEPEEPEPTEEAPEEPEEPEPTEEVPEEPEEPEPTEEAPEEPEEPEPTEEAPEEPEEPVTPEGPPPAIPCAEDGDCDQNAKCVNGACKCNDGFAGNGATCIESCSCRIRGDPIVDFFDDQYCILPPTPGDKKFLLTKYRMTENDECSLMVEVKTSPGQVGEGEILQGANMPRFIDVWFGGEILRFDQQMLLTIGDKEIPLPYNGNGFSVVQNGNFVVLDGKKCGVQVGFEGSGLTSIATIRVPSEFGPELSGMCGNCDGNPNDMRTADGADVTDEPKKCELIANSYVADDSKDNGFPGI